MQARSNVIIKGSCLGGKGVFAARSIKKGGKIFRFSDRLIRIVHKPGCHCSVCKRCINIKEDMWLYPMKGSPGWNLNHSCSPNAYIKGRDIRASRGISAGEEVTIDYSTTNVDTKWGMECNCKSRKCRKLIRSVQSLPESLFEKYRAMMPAWVRKNYKA